MNKRSHWMLFSLLPLVLLASGCGSSNPTAAAAPVDLTGTWSMIGNNFTFTLTMGQTGTVIVGTMDSLSTGELNTPVSGTFSGTAVSFTRYGSPWSGNSQSYTQVYTGTVSADGRMMSGTFSHNGSESKFGWSATR